MPIKTELYTTQLQDWPDEGQHILAHFDAETIVVYQAYQPQIAAYAVAHQSFGGPNFSYSRMSWIKPNFLWMMYRSGWAMKPNQEAILALRLRRAFFEEILALAIPSSYDPRNFANHVDWQAAVETSNVRLQWDPDHDPRGIPQTRRALQLGLRNSVLEQFGKRELLEVVDMTPFVSQQRNCLASKYEQLKIPRERVYTPKNEALAQYLRLSTV